MTGNSELHLPLALLILFFFFLKLFVLVGGVWFDFLVNYFLKLDMQLYLTIL